MNKPHGRPQGRPRLGVHKRIVKGFSADPVIAGRLEAIASERGIKESTIINEALAAWLLKHDNRETAA